MAKESAISNQEIGTVQSIVMAVSGGRVRAQFNQARLRQREALRESRLPEG